MSDDFAGPRPQSPPPTDTAVPHSARIWNYWLGGTDNYPVDREAGDQYREVYPQIVDLALASRAFQARAVRFFAGQATSRPTCSSQRRSSAPLPACWTSPSPSRWC